MNTKMNSEIHSHLPIIPQVGRNLNDKRDVFACGSRGTRQMQTSGALAAADPPAVALWRRLYQRSLCLFFRSGM